MELIKFKLEFYLFPINNSPHSYSIQDIFFIKLDHTQSSILSEIFKWWNYLWLCSIEDQFLKKNNGDIFILAK